MNTVIKCSFFPLESGDNMGYNIFDVLDKLIILEEKAIKMYRQIAATKDISPSLKTVALVLAKEEEKHIESYSVLMENFKDKELDEIDFDIYDKVSSLLNEFQSRIVMPEASDVKSLLSFALELESQNLALLLDIQGRMVKYKDDVEKVSYKVLEYLLEDEKKHIDNLKIFVA